MITVKKVVAEEVDILLNLARTAFVTAFEHLNNPEDFKAYTENTFRREKLLPELKNPDSEFYFAMDGATPIGYIKLNYGNAQTDINDSGSLEIERLYVLQEYQSKQIGKQLMDFAEKVAREQALHYLWLGVWEHNHRALKFYQRNGYEIFGKHKFVLGNDVQTDFLVKKLL